MSFTPINLDIMKFRHLLLTCPVLVLFGGLLWINQLRIWRYDLGMSLREVREISGYDGELTELAIDYDGGPTGLQMKEDVVTYFVDENGVMLMFNHYSELRKTKLIKLFGINIGLVVDRLRS